MFKKILTITLTLLLLIGTSFSLSHHYHSNFLDDSFFVGVIFTLFNWFFTSTGELKARYYDQAIQGVRGIKTDIPNVNKEFFFYPNLPFLTSLIYTLIAFTTKFY